MFRLAKWLPCVAVAVALAAVAPARADITITLSESGYTTQSYTVSSGTSLPQNVQGSIGQYNFSVSTHDTAPGVSQAQGGFLLTQNTLTVSSNTTPTANLVITVSDNSFGNLLPGASTAVNTSLSTTEIDAGTVSAHSFLNSNNTSSISLSGPTVSGSTSGSTSLSFGSGSTFTLGNAATISGLNANQTDNFTVTTVAPVPEPASMMAAFSAVPFLGLGAWLRRRKQAV